LDSPANITNGELFRLKPSLINDLQVGLKRIQRGKQSPAIGSAATADSSLCYLKAEIKSSGIMFLVDSGATYSLMCPRLAEQLQLPAQSLTVPFNVQSVSKHHISIRKFVVCNVSFDGFVVPLQFYLFPGLIGSVILGIDALRVLEAELSLSSDQLSITYNGSSHRIQLFNSDHIDDVEIPDDDKDDDSDDDSLPLVAHVHRLECMDTGLVGAVDVAEEHAVEKSQVSAIPESDAELLQILLDEFSDIFITDLSQTSGIDCPPFTIKLRDSTVEPYRARLRRYSPKEKETIKKEIDVMLEKGVIEPSNAEWTAPIVVVPKKDGSLRFCVNYKRLNDLSVKDPYPLPRIDDHIETLSGKRYVSCLDAFAGYWQINVDVDSRPFTTFISPFGLFQFVKMPFGLSNAPAYFTRVLERAFASQLYSSVIIYIDDIAVFSSDFQEHLQQLRKVFTILRTNNIKLKRKKCSFIQAEFVYLGYLISPRGLEPDPSKINVLTGLPVPRNVKQLRSFLGLANYFRRFISAFADLARPLYELLRKDAYFEWNSICNHSFVTIQKALSRSPVLQLPDFSLPFILSTDASSSAVGAVLEQQFDDGLHPIAYFSRRLTSSERNYSNYEREALAVVAAVRHFRTYLIGRNFTIYTDNSAVASLYNAKDPSGRIIRWINFLSQFDCTIVHRSGKDNPVADFLSRPVSVIMNVRPWSLQDVRLYLETKLLPPGVVLDRRAQRLIRNFQVTNGTLFRRTRSSFKQVLFSINELTDKLDVLHNDMGHFSLATIYKWISDRFWRPYLWNEVRDYVKSCHQCQIFSFIKPSYSFDGKSSITAIFEEFCLDFLGPFPTSNAGHKFILVAVEKLSRFPIAIPCDSQTAHVALTLLNTNVVSLFGVPSQFTVDRGSAFTSRLFSDWCTRLNIRLNLVPAYQPEWNGTVERANRTIRYSLTKMCASDWSSWHSVLPNILFGMRSAVSATTGYSPYFLVFGKNPSVPPASPPSGAPNPVLRPLEMSAALNARALLVRASKSSSTVPVFPVDSLVMVQSGRARKSFVPSKLEPRYSGPYRVVIRWSHNYYSVKSSSGLEYLFHVSRLRPYQDRLASHSAPLGRGV
jgi:hypothetical protein